MGVEPDLVIDLCERGHVLATWRHVVLQTYATEARPETVLRATQLMQRHGSAHPGGIGSIVLIAHLGRPPNQASRAAWVQQMRELSGARAALVLFEGTSLRASLVRGVLTGLVQVSRRQLPIHLAATLRDGLPWFLSEMERAGVPCHGAAALTAAIEAVRERATRGD